jgi:EpsI family protein
VKLTTSIRNFVLLALMLTAAGLGMALKPSQKVGAERARINLELIIPKSFGDWTVDSRVTPILPAPELEEKVSAIYDETLARTYVNAKGEYVMLSIAYGGDQTGRLRVHRPESCYSAQGFQVKQVAENTILTGSTSIPVKRLAAQSGSRHEPITYWIRVGNSTVTSLVEQRLTQLRFGLTGEIPDGLIFRISSIDRENSHAYALHDRFVNDLMRALPKNHQATLVGAIGQPAS